MLFVCLFVCQLDIRQVKLPLLLANFQHSHQLTSFQRIKNISAILWFDVLKHISCKFNFRNHFHIQFQKSCQYQFLVCVQSFVECVFIKSRLPTTNMKIWRNYFQVPFPLREILCWQHWWAHWSTSSVSDMNNAKHFDAGGELSSGTAISTDCGAINCVASSWRAASV